jgi:hypothetical protein
MSVAEGFDPSTNPSIVAPNENAAAAVHDDGVTSDDDDYNPTPRYLLAPTTTPMVNNKRATPRLSSIETSYVSLPRCEDSWRRGPVSGGKSESGLGT